MNEEGLSHTILTPIGIFRGNADSNYQYYQLQAEDNNGKLYLLSLGCKLIYVDSVEKVFTRRLVLIPAPKIETKKEENKVEEKVEDGRKED